jgi:flagellar motor protein MotB
MRFILILPQVIPRHGLISVFWLMFTPALSCYSLQMKKIIISTFALLVLFSAGCATKDIKKNPEYRKLSAKYDRMKLDQDAKDKKVAAAHEAITARFRDDINSGAISVRTVNGVLIIYVQDTFAFKPNSPDLNDAFEAKLKVLAEEFAKTPDKMIRVEGHTATGGGMSKAELQKYPSSWELGAARAISVVRYFQNQCNVKPENMVVVTFGAFRPIASNNAESGKKLNRRVEISLVDNNLYNPGVIPSRIDETLLISEDN